MIRLRTIISFFAAFPAFALAEEGPPSTNPADRVEVGETDVVYAYARRQRPLDAVGSSVSVITSDDIDAGQFAFAADALRLAPGVSLARNGGAGGFASIRLRGASSGQTLVVVDGVVVNDPSAPQGGFNFANLDVADIDQIDVLRGPQSIIYGADAIGGVIAIRTKREGPALAAYAEGGSRASLRGGVTLHHASRNAFVRATISGARTDGISRAASGVEKDGHRSIAGSVTAGLDIGDDAALSLFARASNSRAEIDGFPPPFFAFADTSEIENTTDYAASGRLSHGDFDDAAARDFSGALTVSFSGVNRNTTDLGVETFLADGARLSADYVAAAKLSDWLTFEAGGEIERTSARVSGVNDRARAGALYALLEATPMNGLTVSAGARRDEFSNFDGATTARAAAAYSLTEHLRLRASWGEGFRAPTLFELNFDQFGVVPNPDLRPERATGMDVGVDYEIGGARLSATWFRQRVRDQIDFDLARNGYFNIERVKSDGVELELDAPLGRSASAHFAYSYIDARDAMTGAAIPRTPTHSGSATLSVSPTDTLSLSAVAFFNGEEADFPTPNEAFMRIDLRAAWTISDALQLYARIENAADADYQDVSGYAEPGASVFAGLRVRQW